MVKSRHDLEAQSHVDWHGLPHTHLLEEPTEKPGLEGGAAPAVGLLCASAVQPEALHVLRHSRAAAAGVRLDMAPAEVAPEMLLAEPVISILHQVTLHKCHDRTCNTNGYPVKKQLGVCKGGRQASARELL